MRKTRICKGCKDPICKKCFDTEVTKWIDDFCYAHEDNYDYDCEERGHPEKCQDLFRKKNRRDHFREDVLKRGLICQDCREKGVTEDDFY